MPAHRRLAPPFSYDIAPIRQVTNTPLARLACDPIRENHSRLNPSANPLIFNTYISHHTFQVCKPTFLVLEMAKRLRVQSNRGTHPLTKALTSTA